MTLLHKYIFTLKKMTEDEESLSSYRMLMLKYMVYLSGLLLTWDDIAVKFLEMKFWIQMNQFLTECSDQKMNSI
jgi:hypothetical protein